MLKHMGFTCWVTSSGASLQTYNEESLGNVRTAWIASTSGKSFAVHWQDHSRKRIATSGHVLIDGKDVASAIIRPGRDTPVKRTGAKMRRNVIKPFVFSELSLTDDDDIASPYDTSLGKVGTIRIEITRVRLGAEVPFSGYDEAQNPGVVHERAKKAGAHCTNFGDAKRVENAKTVSISTAPYDPNEPGPYVIFEFRYRSLEMLKAIGIVQTGRKRLIESSGNDEVIEIESSDDEAPSSTLHNTSSPSPDSPSKKRIKTEPLTGGMQSSSNSSPSGEDGETKQQADLSSCLPPSNSPALDGSQANQASNDFDVSQSQTQPDDTQASQQVPSSSPSKSSNELTTIVKEEENEDEDEELDMLAGDTEYYSSTDPSQNVDAFPLDLPPPSSSPGPEVFAKEEVEEDELDS